MPKQLFLILTVATWLCALTAQCDIWEEAPDPNNIDTHPHWVPFDRMQTTGLSSSSHRRKLGDKTYDIGDPELGQWAEQAIPTAHKLHATKFGRWLTLVQFYRIEKAHPVLLRIAQDELEVDDFIVKNKRRELFFAIALTATKDSIPTLKQMLQAPRPAYLKDERYAEMMWGYDRPLITAALYRLGEADARQRLMDKWNERMFGGNSSNEDNHYAGVFRNCSDREIYRQTLALFENNRRNKLPLETGPGSQLFDKQIVGLQMEKLRKLIETRKPEAYATQATAVYAFAERGTVEDVPRLDRLARHANQQLENSAKAAQSGKERVALISLKNLARAADKALIIMRCRLWKELKQ